MSATLAVVRRKVRYHLNDLDNSQPVWTDPQINMAISTARVLVAGATYMPHAWSNADFSTTTATDTYALSGTPEIEQVLAVVDVATGLEIELVSRAAFQDVRDGLDVPSSASGVPMIGCLIESVANVISVQLHPWPDGVYSYNVLRAQLSADAGHTDATSLAFNEHGIEALAARAASLLAGRAAPDVLAKAKLGGNCMAVFAAIAGEAEANSRIRRRRLAAVGQTRRTRRW